MISSKSKTLFQEDKSLYAIRFNLRISKEAVFEWRVVFKEKVVLVVPVSTKAFHLSRLLVIRLKNSLSCWDTLGLGLFAMKGSLS